MLLPALIALNADGMEGEPKHAPSSEGPAGPTAKPLPAEEEEGPLVGCFSFSSAVVARQPAPRP